MTTALIRLLVPFVHVPSVRGIPVFPAALPHAHVYRTFLRGWWWTAWRGVAAAAQQALTVRPCVTTAVRINEPKEDRLDTVIREESRRRKVDTRRGTAAIERPADDT